MVFTKTIVQVYPENSFLTFEDFFRGTLRLLQFANNNSIDVRVNLEGNPISQYVYVQNYPTFNFPVASFWMYKDNALLETDLENFNTGSLPIFPVTSNVWLKRTDISSSLIQEFNKLVQFTPEIYSAANLRIQNDILNMHTIDLTGQLFDMYSIIYVPLARCLRVTQMDILSVAKQIRDQLDFNKPMIVLSNNKWFKEVLTNYLRISYIPGISAMARYHDPTDDGVWTLEDTVINYILLTRAK